MWSVWTLVMQVSLSFLKWNVYNLALLGCAPHLGSALRWKIWILVAFILQSDKNNLHTWLPLHDQTRAIHCISTLNMVPMCLGID